MLTVDFEQFPIHPGERVLDLGCGFGRHAFEAYRRGAHVVAVDRSADEVREVTAMFRAMAAEGEAPSDTVARAVRADLLLLPFPDASFDVVINVESSHCYGHVDRFFAEVARVLRPGGWFLYTDFRGATDMPALHAPDWWLNCALGKESLPSRAYHQVLVWDIMRRPLVTRVAERLLNPVLGKSLVVYAEKPAAVGAARVAA